MSFSDGELARSAQHGDVAALAALFEGHRAALHGRALVLLGDRDGAADAVQDTFLVAMRRLGDLRDPDAAAGWLHAVLRNECLQRLRRTRREAPLTDTLDHLADGSTPSEELERHAIGDWAWTAIGRLPEEIRATVMLRYFGSLTAYEDIAAVQGVAVGTVRSRLARGRSMLADELLATAGAVHLDVRELQTVRRRHFTAAASEISNSASGELFTEGCTPDVLVTFAGGPTSRGQPAMLRGIEEDIATRTRFTIQEVITGPDVTIIHATFDWPSDPARSRLLSTQVHLHDGHATREMRVWLSPPAT